MVYWQGRQYNSIIVNRCKRPGRCILRKVTQNYVLFVLLFLLGLFQAVSGFIMWLAVPHVGGGSKGAGSTATFWSLTRDNWIDLHDWVAVALLVVVIIHIILHWKWIVYMTKSYFRGTAKSSQSR